MSTHIPLKKSDSPLTVVNFVLDKSGSMEVVRDATIKGFNEYINALKGDKNSYRFSLTMFDTEVQKHYIDVPIGLIAQLSNENYRPDGGTALYDAACRSIDTLEAHLRPSDKVLMVIMTDGEENSSKEFTELQFKARVERLEATGRWSFVFMGANQDAWATAQQWGFTINNVATYQSTATGTTKGFSTLASNTTKFAGAMQSATASFFSKEDKVNLNSGN